MSHPCTEPSLAEAMTDPLIQALMLADAVHPGELRALMRETARRIELGFYAPESTSTPPSPAADQH